MWCRLIIDGNAVYEIDEECLRKKQGKNVPQSIGRQKDTDRGRKNRNNN